MLRNLGGWKFADVTDASGTRDPGSKTIGAVALDYDGDGRTDLYVANDQWRNTLFHNEGGGRFRDVSDRDGDGLSRGRQRDRVRAPDAQRHGARRRRTSTATAGRTSTSRTSRTSRTRSTATSRARRSPRSEREAFGGDHDPVVPLSKWGVVGARLRQRRAGRPRGLERPDPLALLHRRLEVVQPAAKNFEVGEKSYAQRQFLFHNESAPGAMKFRDVSAEAGDLGRIVVVGRGLSAGDLDGDGKEDLVFNPIGAPAYVFRNTSPGGNFAGDPARRRRRPEDRPRDGGHRRGRARRSSTSSRPTRAARGCRCTSASGRRLPRT